MTRDPDYCDDPRPSLKWTADQLAAAADVLGTICGNVVRASDPVDWEATPTLHDAEVEILVATLVCPDPRPPSCPKCGSTDVAIVFNSATCLRACKWTGAGVEAELAGRTFYRATLSNPEIHVGSVKVLEPEGMAAVDRIKSRALTKIQDLANRVKVTRYLEYLRDKEDPLSAYIANEMVKHDE